MSRKFTFFSAIMILAGLTRPLAAQTGDGGLSIFGPVKYDNNHSRLTELRAGYITLNTDYLVSPGDTYQVTYVSQSASLVRQDFFIEGDFTVNLAVFGKFNASGLSFDDLKKRVEAIIGAAYPGSLPQVIIKSPGVFEVPVKGEVRAAVRLSGWSFMRLSAAVTNAASPYASLRRVEVVDAAGNSLFYDVYRAVRYGATDQDPYIKRGDTIIMHPYQRLVKISGEVKQPDAYQILPGDSLRVLIEEYANGFTLFADLKRIEIVRIVSETSEFGETLYFDFSDNSIAGDFVLKNMDQVTVYKKTDRQPMVFFQGAVGKNEAGTQVSNRVPVPITVGQRLSTAARQIQDQLTLVSDLENIMIIRETLAEPLRVNLKALLYEESEEVDIELRDQDTIIVPFRQYFVFVGGEVRNPGRYPYLAGRDWKYYVGMAGGFDIDTHIGAAVEIYDVYGNSYSQEERLIQPEDTIFAPRNHFMYWIGKVGSDISTIISTTAGVVVIANLIADLFSAEQITFPLSVPSAP